MQLPFALTIRYLNLYEKVNFLGEDPDIKDHDDEEGPTRKKVCLPIETIPLNYNYNQHKLSGKNLLFCSINCFMSNLIFRIKL